MIDSCKELGISIDSILREKRRNFYAKTIVNYKPDDFAMSLFEKFLECNFNYLDDKVKEKFDVVETLRNESNETLYTIAQTFGYTGSYMINSIYSIEKLNMNKEANLEANLNKVLE